MNDYKLTGQSEETFLRVVLNHLDTPITTICGSLCDNYFIDYFNKGLQLKRGRSIKPRKHLIAFENPLNEWSSDMTILLTDNDKLYYQTKKEYIEDYLKTDAKNDFLEEEIRDDLELELEECKEELGETK